METKHTPGPWRWDEPENWCRLSARVFHENTKLRTYEPIAQVEISGWGRRRGLANARLIALAPEMLALLERILDKLKPVDRSGDEVINEARALLAKLKA